MRKRRYGIDQSLQIHHCSTIDIHPTFYRSSHIYILFKGVEYALLDCCCSLFLQHNPDDCIVKDEQELQMQHMRQAIQSYVGRGFNLKTMKRILTFILAIIGSVSIYAQEKSTLADALKHIEDGRFIVIVEEAIDVKTQSSRTLHSTRVEVKGDIGSMIWGSSDKIISNNHWNDNAIDKQAKVTTSRKKPSSIAIEIDNAFNRGYRIECNIDAEGNCSGMIYYYNEVFCTYRGRVAELYE